ncbi:MAG: DNA polymerase III subunit delta [Bacteroidota bacterium]
MAAGGTFTFEQIVKDLKNKVYYPVYFLMGEEPFFIDRITDFIEDNILDETEKEFNQAVLYGVDIDVPTILAYAKRFPMMASHQVVIVKEAQNIKNLIPVSNDDTKKKKDVSPLEHYIENPLKSTILVFCYKYKKLDMRRSLTKTIAKSGVLFDAKKLSDYKVPEWTEQYIIQQKLKISPPANTLLTEYLGNDLSKIANEVSKLKINLPEGTEVTIDHIEQFIGISKDFNVFELQNAIGKKDILKANQIIKHFAENEKDNPLPMTMAVMYSYFSKVACLHSIKKKYSDISRHQVEVAAELHVQPYFVKDYEIAARNYNLKKLHLIFDALRETDIRSKGVDNATIGSGELMKELMYKILH